MAQILENEFCDKCKQNTLVEEYHLWGVEKYCTSESCDYTYSFVIEDECETSEE